jgi:hypothetical protein
MKALGLGAAALILVTTIATAQPPGKPRGPAVDIDRLAVLLDLNDYQRGELERALSEQRAARQATRAAAREGRGRGGRGGPGGRGGRGGRDGPDGGRGPRPERVI